MASRQVEIVVRRSGQPEQRMPLGAGITHIGRAEDNDLVLPDIGVSRRHARVVVEDDTVRFEDLGSGNGSFYRGRRIEQQAVVDGDEIVIEPFVIQFRITEPVGLGRSLEDDETLRAPAMDAMGGAPARLVVLAGHRLASAYPLGGAPVSMGRSEARDVVLYDPAASRDHARVELRSEGYWLRDNDSANGTFLNGRRVTEHPLNAGDVIRIGSTEFRFELLGPVPALPERPTEDPTIRGPESIPALPPVPPPPGRDIGPVAATPPPPVANPGPASVPPASLPPISPIASVPSPEVAAPYAAPGISPAQEMPWSQPAEPAAQPVMVSAEPETGSNRRLLVAVASAVAGFILLLVLVVGGAGAWYLWQQSKLETEHQAAVAQATEAMRSVDYDDEIDALVDEGRLLLHEGRYLDSASRFYKVLQQEPQHEEAKRLGFLVVDYIALDQLYEDALRRSADDAEKRRIARDARALAQRALQGRESLLEARDALDLALVLNPSNTDLLGDLERIRAARADDLNAAELKRLHDKVAGIYAQGVKDLAEGRQADAINAFEKVQKADPDRRTWYWYEARAGLEEARAGEGGGD